MIDINDYVCVDVGSIILVEIVDRADEVFVEIKERGRVSVKIAHGETKFRAADRIRLLIEDALGHD